MKLPDLKAGDKLAYWHDTGARGATLCYVEVLKVCRVLVKVRGENGNVAYKPPGFFSHKISEQAWKDRNS